MRQGAFKDGVFYLFLVYLFMGTVVAILIPILIIQIFARTDDEGTQPNDYEQVLIQKDTRHAVEIAVRTQISEKPIEMFTLPLQDRNEEALAALGSPGSDIIRDIAAINGIDAIFIKPFSISAHVYASFTLEEIEPQVQDVLEKYI